MILHGDGFFRKHGCATTTHICSAIPTIFRAGPKIATRAMLEELFCFFDGGSMRILPGFASEQLIHLLACVSHSAPSAQQSTRNACQTGRHSKWIVLVLRHVTGAAEVTPELESKAGNVRTIPELASEGNQSHRNAPMANSD
jgi:hypothetical protein